MPARVSGSLFLVLAVCLLLPMTLAAQSIGGALGGTVKDESGAAVPAALVKVINTQTGTIRSVSTDNEGRYQVRELPPGSYEVVVERSGFNTAKVEKIRVSVAQVARLDDVTLAVASIGQEITVNVQADVALIDSSTPTLSTSFSDKQIRELPILSRDINTLALLAPGVFSVRTFSFASTLVPFAANGSRGRDNNFIIDSVDNNEPLFGGAAAQFTNTDLFAEYRILTNQYKAEYGRNTGSVVNIITERGGNQWRGSLFYFGQHDSLNAATAVEKQAGIGGPARFFENQVGATLGGPLKKESAWVFLSYQWDRARNDISPIFPLIATLPTTNGLNSLSGAAFAGSDTVPFLLSLPSLATVPGVNAPCSTGVSSAIPPHLLPTANPCTVGSVLASVIPAPLAPVEFGTFLVPRASIFDVRDHQFSVRIDKRLGQRDEVYGRYLFDDLRTPRTTGASPVEVAFSDLGLLPEWRAVFLQRTQSLGIFWTRAWPTALHELRFSFTRIASKTGPFEVDVPLRELTPAVTVLDDFATTPAPGGNQDGTNDFLAAFRAAGRIFTLGRDTRPGRINSNLIQVQDNFSFTKGIHGIKIGANFVRTRSNIRQIPSDLGQYIYSTFDDFVNNLPVFAFQRIGNFGGQGGPRLPLRELGQFYFLQDDIRVSRNFTFSVGLRYENYGQAANRVGELNPSFGRKIETDHNNFAPRVGFAWSPDGKFVLRGGYGIYYNPTAFNIALIAFQSGPISPFLVGVPTNTFPSQPFNIGDVTQLDVNFTAQDTISRNLVNPYVQNYSLSMQRQFGRDFLAEVSYVGSKGRSLFQRVDLNPNTGWRLTPSVACPAPPCQNARRDPTRAAITEVANGSNSNYHALQVGATHRLTRTRLFPLALTAAYTWSHMIDNASEIFGPGVRILNAFSRGGAAAVEAITPFAQNPNDTVGGERGNSSFDRRHRVALSFLLLLPSPSSRAGRAFLGNWQLSGFFTAQSGQPFSPINGGLNTACEDAYGDGVLTNDRPLTGNPNAPANSVALLNNTLCVDPSNPLAAANRILSTAGDYIAPISTPTGPGFVGINASDARFVQAGLGTTGVPQAGTVGRNTLRGPRTVNFDLAVFKNLPFGENNNLQFRFEFYNLFNTRNPGNLLGNVFTSDAQPVPAIAFAPVGPTVTPARVIGVIPENTIDTVDRITGDSIFLSRRFMNTGARRVQFGVKLLF